MIHQMRLSVVVVKAGRCTAPAMSGAMQHLLKGHEPNAFPRNFLFSAEGGKATFLEDPFKGFVNLRRCCVEVSPPGAPHRLHLVGDLGNNQQDTKECLNDRGAQIRAFQESKEGGERGDGA